MSKRNHALLGILGGISILSILIVSLLANKASLNANVVEQELEIFPCVDTDGGHDLYLKGTVIGKNMQEEDFCFTGDNKIVDQCIGRGCYLMEHFCHHPTNPRARDGNRIQRQCFRNTPCIQGACVEVNDFQQAS